MNPYFEITRPLTSFLAALGAVIGAVISGLPFSGFYFLIFLVVFLLSSAGMVINDYYDIEIDKINAPQRPLPSGRIKKEDAFIFSLFLFTLGVLLSAFLNIYCFLLVLLNSVLEFLYARNFKKGFLFGNILVSYFTASTFLFGALITFDFKIILVISLMAFLANLGREIYKGIEDIKGDKKLRLETLPVISGKRSAREIAQGCIALAVVVSYLPYFLGFFDSLYLKMISIPNVLFLYSFSLSPSKFKFISKGAMYLALLAFLFSI